MKKCKCMSEVVICGPVKRSMILQGIKPTQLYPSIDNAGIIFQSIFWRFKCNKARFRWPSQRTLASARLATAAQLAFMTQTCLVISRKALASGCRQEQGMLRGSRCAAASSYLEPCPSVVAKSGSQPHTILWCGSWPKYVSKNLDGSVKASDCGETSLQTP